MHTSFPGIELEFGGPITASNPTVAGQDTKSLSVLEL